MSQFERAFMVLKDAAPMVASDAEPLPSAANPNGMIFMYAATIHPPNEELPHTRRFEIAMFDGQEFTTATELHEYYNARCKADDATRKLFEAFEQEVVDYYERRQDRIRQWLSTTRMLPALTQLATTVLAPLLRQLETMPDDARIEREIPTGTLTLTKRADDNCPVLATLQLRDENNTEPVQFGLDGNKLHYLVDDLLAALKAHNRDPDRCKDYLALLIHAAKPDEP